MAESQCLSRLRNELELRRRLTQLQLDKQSELMLLNEDLKVNLKRYQQECEERKNLNFKLRKSSSDNQFDQIMSTQKSILKLESDLLQCQIDSDYEVALAKFNKYKAKPNTVIKCKGCKEDFPVYKGSRGFDYTDEYRV